MAIPGLIENYSGWTEVVDPNFEQPNASTWSRLLRKRPERSLPPSVKVADFISPDIRHAADTFFNATKAILTSTTVAHGGLGNPDQIQHLLTSQLYNRLVAMRTLDETFVEISAVDTSTTDTSTEIAQQMRTLAKETFTTAVEAPTKEIEDLANQVKLRDMQHRLPQLSEKLDGDSLTGHNLDNLEFLAARLQALCDLDTTIR